VDYRVLDASKNPINQAGMTPQEHVKINGQDTKRSRHELVFVFKNGKEMHRNNIMVGQYGRDLTNVGNTLWRSVFPEMAMRERRSRGFGERSANTRGGHTRRQSQG
jgi:hypothetical protein